MHVTELVTDRLVLRGWQSSDRAPFRTMNADPVVMEFFPSVLTADESDRLAAGIQSNLEERGWGLWAVEVTDGPSFIGFVGLSPAGIGGRDLAPMVEVGWRLMSPAWGRGFATEAARAAVAHGFDVLGLDEIVSFTAASNARSRAVMERLGMLHDPGEDFDHPLLPAGHPVRPHVLYRLRRTRFNRAAVEPRSSGR